MTRAVASKHYHQRLIQLRQRSWSLCRICQWALGVPSITKNMYKRLSKTVSVVKKSHASRPSA
jgi:hypothetical protein